MYHANKSRKRSFLRASRPISAPVGASADTLLVEAFSVAALALDCFFIALSDVFDAFRDDLVGVRGVRLAVLPRKEIDLRITSRHLISGFVELMREIALNCNIPDARLGRRAENRDSHIRLLSKSIQSGIQRENPTGHVRRVLHLATGGLLALAAPRGAGGTFKPLRRDEAPDPRDQVRELLSIRTSTSSALRPTAASHSSSLRTAAIC